MEFLRPMRYRLMDGIDSLPGPINRPIMCVIAFVYIERVLVFRLFLPFWLICAIIPLLISDLPPAESIPCSVVLALVSWVLWRQFFRIEQLQERVKDLELKLDAEDDDEED